MQPISQMSGRVLTRFSDKFALVSDYRSQIRTERLADLRQLRSRHRTTSPRTRRISRLIPTSQTPTAGTVPATRSPSNDYYRSSGSISYDESSSPTHTANPEATGTVPATGAVSNECDGFSGSSGSDERPSRTHPATPNAAGIVPAMGVMSSDYCESSGDSG